MASQSTEDDRGNKSTVIPTAFKPYTSILKFTSAPARLQHADNTELKKAAPPWRRAVGRVHFTTDYMDCDSSLEDGEYGEILACTFAGFSDEVIGLDVPVVDFGRSKAEVDWSIDEHPGPPQVAGGKDVMYDVTDETVHTTPIKNK
jgi:hypothetical protein